LQTRFGLRYQQNIRAKDRFSLRTAKKNKYCLKNNNNDLKFSLKILMCL